ncbi:hypothetical protein EDD11_003822 [Mortierella claussenii]|nr:hypothetical protein EDD11_003822 [Mortierella claussenii]
MLLLIPSHKTEVDGTGKSISPSGRVLVVLPSDTDLSSNVVVPDTAITTTLGTNDSVESMNCFPTSPFAFQQQPNSRCSPSNHRDDSFIKGQMGFSDDQNNRSRRHSHSGLEGGGYSSLTSSQYRSRSRQSISHSSPYQYQTIRTPRTLRAAFRKARKDQSPLLTSTSFGTDYATLDLSSDLDDDDMAPKATMAQFNTQKRCYGFLSPKSPVSSNRVQNTGDSDGDEDRDANSMSDLMASGSSSNAIAETATKQWARESSEIVDIDGVSDEEMGADAASTAVTSQPMVSETDSLPRKSEAEADVQDRDLDLGNTFDADMLAILGMASDMELVMPAFENGDLDDVEKDYALIGSGRRSRSATAVSPSCSHSSSTTITYMSCRSSPRSRSRTPNITIVESSYNSAGSVPVSPSVLDTHKRSQTSEPPEAAGCSISPTQVDSDSRYQDLSTPHEDLGNLRQHRDTSKQNSKSLSDTSSASFSAHHALFTPSSSSSSSFSSSSSSSSSTATRGRRSQGPIYFKPSHHRLPDRTNAMAIQSTQWSQGDHSPASARAGHPFDLSGFSSLPNNGNSYMGKVQPSSEPPLLLDKSAIMTANSISRITASMSVLTPQEVQDDYYARRNLRIHHQRQRRRSATAAAGGHMAHLGLSEASFLPLARRSSATDIHPLEKLVVPAIGSNPLPASYYIPPSAFRTEAAVAAEKEAERKRREMEEETFLVFPSPTLS